MKRKYKDLEIEYRNRIDVEVTNRYNNYEKTIGQLNQERD